jgi:hypothetical protein
MILRYIFFFVIILIFGAWTHGSVSGGPAPVVNSLAVVISSPVTNGGSVATATCASNCTGLTWSIIGGNSAGNFAINSSTGAITTTSSGVTNIVDAHDNFVLTVQASNGNAGNNSAAIDAYADGSVGAPAGTAQYPNLMNLKSVVLLNVIGGSGYSNGTGYAWTSSGGGCSGNASGTVDVVGGALTNGVISGGGSGCTSRPTISVPAGAGGGSGGSIIPSVWQKVPPWKVAGVNYHVGITNGTSLSDPSMGGLPSGATYSGNIVTVSGNNVTLNGWNFCAQGSIALKITGTGATITNNSFCATSHGASQGGYAVEDTSGGAVIEFNEFNGLGVCSYTSGAPQANCAGSGLAMVAMLGITGCGSPTVQWNYFYQSDFKHLNYNGGNCTIPNRKEQFNLYVNSSTCGESTSGCGTHGESEYTCSANAVYSSDFIQFNTAWEQFNRQGNGLEAPMAYIADCGSTISGAQWGYNVVLAPGTGSTTGGGGTYQTGSVGIFNGWGQMSPITFLNNTFQQTYISCTGVLGTCWSSPGTQYVSGLTYQNNVNLDTGNDCEPAAWASPSGNKTGTCN